MNVHTDARAGIADTADLWSEFGVAQDGPNFLLAWLRLLMRQAGGASLGALLIRQPEGGFAPVAVWREEASGKQAEAADAAELGPVCELAIRQRSNVVRPAGDGAHVAQPIQTGADGTVEAVLALGFGRHPGVRLAEVFRAGLWASGWLEAAWLRGREGGASRRAERAGGVLAILAAVTEQADFDAALMACCNEAADRFQADRVAIGLVRRSARCRLAAMSHAATVKRRTALAATLETAQAEAVAQAAPVAVPPVEGSRPGISAAHRLLTEQFGASAVISLPLVSEGEIVAVLTLERAATPPGISEGRLGPAQQHAFTPEELDTLRLVAALAGPVIGARLREHRWVSGRLRHLSGGGLRKLFGRRHPGAKLLAVSAAALVTFLAFAQTEVRVTARAVIEGEVQRAVTAPFNGFVAEAPVRAGQRVEAGRLLARLDDRDLLLEQLKWDSERAKAEQRQREAMARAERATMLLAGAQASQAEAELALVREKLARTKLVAPVEGLVVSGDLSQMLGAPIEQGKVLFEIAPLDAVRVVLQVAETDYRLVAEHASVGQATIGQLVLTGEGGEQRPIRVTLVTPVAEARDGRNTFRIEAALARQDGTLLRPGMEGIAKLDVGRGAVLYSWSRTTIDRLRLFIWNWMP